MVVDRRADNDSCCHGLLDSDQAEDFAAPPQRLALHKRNKRGNEAWRLHRLGQDDPTVAPRHRTWQSFRRTPNPDGCSMFVFKLCSAQEPHLQQ